jgi:YegS/Rv2252/BmrU family lipid kinase
MSESGTIAILGNVKAGRHHAERIAREIIAILESRAIPYQYFGHQWPASLSSFHSLWVIGGDGTMNYLINHVSGHVPPMVLFKAGTGNDFAKQLYGNASVKQTVEIALAATPRPVDAGICNGQYFINIAGIGFEGEVLKHMKAIRWLGPFWGYNLAVIRVIMGFREPVYNITIDDGRIDTKMLLLLMVSNAPETGGGFRVSPLAEVNDGKLDLVTVTRLGALKRLIHLPSVRKGKHLSLPFVEHRTLRKISITADREVKAQLDGEMISGKQFEIEICPAKFQFLY